MSSEEAKKNPIGEIFGAIWFLFVAASIAAYLGFIDIPKPVQNLLDRFFGDDPQAFESLTIEMPANQLAFIAAVQKSREAYSSTNNDIAKATIRTQRKQQICTATNGYTDGYWFGIIDKVTTNGDGLGVISVKIAPHIILKTWNNSLSDIGQNTMIKPGTPIYNLAASLKTGDKVKFTGQFFEDEQDCLSESSLTIDGAMTEPEFIVSFGSLETI